MNNRISWRQKLASRKFWALLAALAVSILGAFGFSEETTLRVTGILSAVGACAAYMFAEALTDQASGSAGAGTAQTRVEPEAEASGYEDSAAGR
ncbi:phage holin family protein [Paenibacillus glufosinatiresistens]|uniref:hypothetical protein n=1 Tax=Paenibacillus glufosinatiresistens TaxID=3070657 RepID=UPI00286E4B48|nr:hypothetical protein [Paenibacillus sp. YX.27]